MITLHERGVWLVGGAPADAFDVPAAEARKRTMAWRILQTHNRSGDPEKLRVGFDAMLSHDITYVGIIQQARASGMTEFPFWSLSILSRSVLFRAFAWASWPSCSEMTVCRELMREVWEAI